MMWAEVRELVATSSAARKSSGEAAPPAAGPQGLHSSQQSSSVHSSTKGISNELVIARLRGKVDHLTNALEVREHEKTQLQLQLQNQHEQAASSGQQARVDQLTRDLAQKKVHIKELEQVCRLNEIDGRTTNMLQE